MAFAVVGAQGFGLPTGQPSETRGVYVLEMSITGAAGDVTHDLDDTATPGTFWTSALANATYGDIAQIVKEKIEELDTFVSDLSWSSRVLSTGYVRVAGAPGGATEFQVDGYGATNNVPSIVFNAASAPTAYRITMNFTLEPGKYFPEAFKAGTI